METLASIYQSIVYFRLQKSRSKHLKEVCFYQDQIDKLLAWYDEYYANNYVNVLEDYDEYTRKHGSSRV